MLSPVRRNGGKLPANECTFPLGRLRIDCEDAANGTVMAGFVVEVARYVQGYRGAEIVGFDTLRKKDSIRVPADEEYRPVPLQEFISAM